MRSPGSVYKKLKEVKYRHLVVLYKKYFRRIPENCLYNYRYVFSGEEGREGEIRLCMLHQDTPNLKTGIMPHLVDLCTESNHCLRCNGFANKHTKEDVRELFEEELKNKNTKEKKYPDICALEWVLERSVVGLPPATWLQTVWYAIKRKVLRNKIL